MNARRTARKNMSASKRMDLWLKGKNPDEQLKRLNLLVSQYKDCMPMDRYLEAVNRKIKLESNGISKRKPLTEGIRDSAGLSAAMALSGLGGC